MRVPEPQHMIALHRANKIRLERAAVKREIHANDRVVLRVLEDPPECMRSCSIMELLCSQRRWGSTRSRKFLYRSAAGVTEGRKLEEITTRQRIILCADLEGARV